MFCGRRRPQNIRPYENRRRSMQFYLQQIINALQVGSVYALIALGYTMVYGILSLINFAHGDIFMVSAYVAFFVATALVGLSLHLPPLLVFLMTMLASMFVTALLAVVIERVAYRPLRQAPKMSAVITALGVGLLLENLFVAVKPIGPSPRTAPDLLPNVTLPLASITAVQALIIVTALGTMFLLDLLVRRTMLGAAMRAISWDVRIVPLMGIPVDRVVSFTFAVGAMVAAIGGTLYGMRYSIDPYMGIRIGWWAFIAAVVGGIGNIRGAMVGGFILGFVEIFTPVVLPSTYRDGIAFSLLLVLLVLRPTGLLGRLVSQKL
jgi:branched-chain amino acid transport system permease protein